MDRHRAIGFAAVARAALLSIALALAPAERLSAATSAIQTSTQNDSSAVSDRDTTGESPLILLDAAHHNLDSDAGRHALIEWLDQNGYDLREIFSPFTRQRLSGAQVIIIKNALPLMGPDEWTMPTPSAFAWEEIEAVREWVLRGGGLMLVLDHMPMPGAATLLADAFDIEASNGYAVDESMLESFDPQTVARAGTVVFRRSDGSLAEHPVTNGRRPRERVDSVLTYSGAALRVTPRVESLLTLGPTFVSLLPEDARTLEESTPREPVGGWSQAVLARLGAGRIAVLADGAILITPAMARAGLGERRPLQNPQFLLNVLGWLSGTLDEPR